jgi:HK97 family phage portal protein
MKFRERLNLAWKALTYSDDWIRILRQASGQFFESSAGVDVDAESAMRISTVNACIRIISYTIASLPLDVYKRLDGGGREIARNHPNYNLLHTRPNVWQTSFLWRQQMAVHLLTRGNYYALILDHGDGIIDDLIPLDPDRITVTQRQDFSLQYTYQPTSGADPVVISQEQMLHIRGLSSDGILGRSVIGDARESFGAALATQEHTSRYWANGATPDGVIKINGPLKKEQADRIRALWNDDHQGSRNAHKIHVLGEGASYEKIGITAEDAQFIETRRFQKADIAGLFGVPMFLLQSDTSTVTYASSEQFMLSFVTHCIRPWAVNIETALHQKLFTAPHVYFPEFNLDAIMRGDLKSRYEAYAIARNWGLLSKNEIRARENENPIEGGDDYRSTAEIQNAKQLQGGAE